MRMMMMNTRDTADGLVADLRRNFALLAAAVACGAEYDGAGLNRLATLSLHIERVERRAAESQAGWSCVAHEDAASTLRAGHLIRHEGREVRLSAVVHQGIFCRAVFEGGGDHVFLAATGVVRRSA